MNELFEALKPSILPILQLILSIFATWLGLYLKRLLASMLSAEQDRKVREVIGISVGYVEQVAKALGFDSKAKFDEALSTAQQLLSAKGIVISDIELKILIESTVNEFYGNWKMDEEPAIEPDVLKVEVTE